MCILKKYVENVFDALIVLFFSCIVWSEMSEGALSDEIKRTQWQKLRNIPINKSFDELVIHSYRWFFKEHLGSSSFVCIIAVRLNHKIEFLPLINWKTFICLLFKFIFFKTGNNF